MPFPQELTDNMILALTDFNTTLGKCGLEYNWEFVTNFASTSFGIYMNKSVASNTATYDSTATCGF